MAANLTELLDRMEGLLAEVEDMDEGVRERVFELLDGVDALHRLALQQIAEVLDADTVARLRAAHPAIAWLFDAYAVDVDEWATADEALESIRPYIHSHGGDVELIEVEDGVVRLRLSGACAGCTASAITLQQGVDEALRDGFPGYAHLEVEETEAPAHPPPGATLLDLQAPDESEAPAPPPPGATPLDLQPPPE